MIASTRPAATLVSNTDKVGGETQLSHSAHSNEDEKERVVMRFDVRHRSKESRNQRGSKLGNSNIRVRSEKGRSH